MHEICTRPSLRIALFLPGSVTPQVILDAAAVIDHLPFSIEAMVLPPIRNADSATKESRANYERKVREAHYKFLQEYGLMASQVPLLSLNLVQRGDSPFKVVILEGG